MNNKSFQNQIENSKILKKNINSCILELFVFTNYKKHLLKIIPNLKQIYSYALVV